MINVALSMNETYNLICQIRNEMPPTTEPRISQALEKAKNKGFADFLLREGVTDRFETVAALADKAGIKPSAVFMVLNGKRLLSDEVALAISKVLHPDLGDPQLTAQRLIEDANSGASAEAKRRRRHLISRGRGGSVLDRVRMRDRIVAGVIVNEPFVHAGRGGGGFAVDVCRHLADLMNLGLDIRTVEFGSLKTDLADGEIDLAVTALLPTFHRRSFMAFSRPLPFLRVPLSALVRRDFHPMPTVEHFLSRVSRDQAYLNETRVLLIQGEVGDEFVRAFFDSQLFDTLEHNKRIRREANLIPARLAERMLQAEYDLFAADLATCRAVMAQPGIRAKYKPLPDPAAIMPPLGSDREEQYPQLASFRVVFGLKKDDQAWQSVINDALESLLADGIRALLSIYRTYLTDYPEDFGLCLVGHDETVSPITQSYFESALPEIAKARERQEEELKRHSKEAMNRGKH